MTADDEDAREWAWSLMHEQERGLDERKTWSAEDIFESERERDER